MIFDHPFQAYKHNGGKKKIVKLIDKDNSAYIAEYILDDTMEILVTMKRTISHIGLLLSPIWKAFLAFPATFGYRII